MAEKQELSVNKYIPTSRVFRMNEQGERFSMSPRSCLQQQNGLHYENQRDVYNDHNGVQGNISRYNKAKQYVTTNHGDPTVSSYLIPHLHLTVSGRYEYIKNMRKALDEYEKVNNAELALLDSYMNFKSYKHDSIIKMKQMTRDNSNLEVEKINPNNI
jgi:hypothetical protein